MKTAATTPLAALKAELVDYHAWRADVLKLGKAQHHPEWQDRFDRYWVAQNEIWRREGNNEARAFMRGLDNV